ncbi:MAG: hypothetical protein R3B13_38245 [Polyangiaceae bacterium]
MVLSYFRSRPDVQKYLAKLILRRRRRPLGGRGGRTLFGGAVDWAKVDRELSAIADVDKRIEGLREASAKAPADPNSGAAW